MIFTQQSSVSLSELNRLVRDVIRKNFPDTYWVRAETSDVRQNRSGHCYLEFIEKDPVTQAILALTRTIWANTSKCCRPISNRKPVNRLLRD